MTTILLSEGKRGLTRALAPLSAVVLVLSEHGLTARVLGADLAVVVAPHPIHATAAERARYEAILSRLLRHLAGALAELRHADHIDLGALIRGWEDYNLLRGQEVQREQ